VGEEVRTINGGSNFPCRGGEVKQPNNPTAQEKRREPTNALGNPGGKSTEPHKGREENNPAGDCGPERTKLKKVWWRGVG